MQRWIAEQSNLCTAAETDVVCTLERHQSKSIPCTYHGVSAARIAATFANERVVFVGDSAGRGLHFKLMNAFVWAELHLKAMAGEGGTEGAVTRVRAELITPALCGGNQPYVLKSQAAVEASTVASSLGLLAEGASSGFIDRHSPRLNATLTLWKTDDAESMHFAGSGFFHPAGLVGAASRAKLRPTLVYGQATNWLLHLFPSRVWAFKDGARRWRDYETLVSTFLRDMHDGFGSITRVWSTANAVCEAKMYPSAEFMATARSWLNSGAAALDVVAQAAHTVGSTIPEHIRPCVSTMIPEPLLRQSHRAQNPSLGDAVSTCIDAQFTQHGINRTNARALAVLNRDENRDVWLLDTPTLTLKPLGRDRCNLTTDGRHYPDLDILKIRVLMSILESKKALAGVDQRASTLPEGGKQATGGSDSAQDGSQTDEKMRTRHPPQRHAPPPPPPAPAHPRHPNRLISWQRCPTSEMRAWRNDYLHDGLVIARGVLDESTISALQMDLEDIVRSQMRRVLGREEHGALLQQELGFEHLYTALYEANVNSASNRGERSDLPSYFRAATHTGGVHKFLTHVRLLELIRCLLPHKLQNLDAAVPLKLYPGPRPRSAPSAPPASPLAHTSPLTTRARHTLAVYMARGKVPDRISKSAMTVDWHQDAEYTYYWYSALNTTIAQIEEYAASVVNTWVPITDTPLELGPVQLMRRRPLSLTRAEFRCEGKDCTRRHWGKSSNDSTSKRTRHGKLNEGDQREYLRVAEIDQYIDAFPERVVTAEMKRGDVLFFDQFTYHRSLPNISPNRTRWSVDFRFQDARVPTLRPHPGFVLGSDKQAVDAASEFGAPLIASDVDWQNAGAVKRVSEAQQEQNADTWAGHAFAEQHLYASDLLGALHLERHRCLSSGCKVAELDQKEQ